MATVATVIAGSFSNNLALSSSNGGCLAVDTTFCCKFLTLSFFFKPTLPLRVWLRIRTGAKLEAETLEVSFGFGFRFPIMLEDAGVDVLLGIRVLWGTLVDDD